MNKTEAVHTNMLLRWIIGEVGLDEVAPSIGVLTSRVHQALGAGVPIERLVEAVDNPATRPRIEHGPIPAAVLELLAALWEQEIPGGGWLAPGVVVTEWFEKQGINTKHPAARAKRGTLAADHKAWDTGALALFAAQHGCDDYAPVDVEGVLD